MVYIMGVALSDHYPAKIALTGIYGIGRTLARRICARLQIHENAPLTALTPQQTTALTAFLSAPSNTPSLGSLALAPPGYRPAFKTNLIDSSQAPSSGPSTSATGAVEPKVAIPRSPTLPTTKDERALMGLGDRLRGLKIETDLRRFVRENIMHHRIVNTYAGRRHAMGLPVRGQRTNSNAKTARRLNKIERRG